MVYKDMTFCEYKDCVKFEQCIRAQNKKSLKAQAVQGASKLIMIILK